MHSSPSLTSLSSRVITVLLAIFTYHNPIAAQTNAMTAAQACTQNIHATPLKYRNDIVLTAFARRDANTSKAGMLYDVEHGLPHLIGLKLERKYNVNIRTQLHTAAPRLYYDDEQRASQHTHELTQRLQAQYVVSGEVIEMSMQDDETTYRADLGQGSINTLFDFFHLPKSWDSRIRHFAFSINVRESTTGQTVFKRNYHTEGVWKIRAPTKVGFTAARFWKTHYGKNIQIIADRAGSDIARAIHCQPFVIAMDSSPETHSIKLKSGANSGLTVGDKIELFQVVIRANTEYQSYNTQLVKSNTQVVLHEVYPNYSIAILDENTLLFGEYVGIISPQEPSPPG